MDKKELIERLNSLPDDICILYNDKPIERYKNGKLEKHEMLDLFIFSEKKDSEFINWFLQP